MAYCFDPFACWRSRPGLRLNCARFSLQSSCSVLLQTVCQMGPQIDHFRIGLGSARWAGWICRRSCRPMRPSKGSPVAGQVPRPPGYPYFLKDSLPAAAVRRGIANRPEHQLASRGCCYSCARSSHADSMRSRATSVNWPCAQGHPRPLRNGLAAVRGRVMLTAS